MNPGSPRRIAIGSIFVECNHLGGQPTTLERFRLCQLEYGNTLLGAPGGAVGGMVDELRQWPAVLVPLLAASACSGGPVTRECYDHLLEALLEPLRRAGKVDGILLALHGSGAVDGIGEMEGHLLQAVRHVVGPAVPIVASLDLHAHVSDLMVQSADALIAFETYPHVDADSTGRRAARMLHAILSGQVRPTMVLAKVPVLVSGANGTTVGDGPFADVMRAAKTCEGQGSVVSVSVFLVHPYLDLPDLGGGALVICHDDMATAETLATDLAMRYWEKRFALDPEVFAPAEAISRGAATLRKPVLLVETADCTGGGAAGDSAACIKALLAQDSGGVALVPVVDPEAAAACHRAGAGADVSLTLGHKLDPKWGDPLRLTGRVLRLHDGRFVYDGGLWQGSVAEMGPSAALEIMSPSGRSTVQVLITTHATYEWSDEQYRALGMDVRQAAFVVVKNPMNYRQGYRDLAGDAFILDTPGPTPATLHHVRHRHLERPYYPADVEIEGLQPRVYRSSRHLSEPGAGAPGATCSPQRIARWTRLKRGMEDEYVRTHSVIWPEMQAAIAASGIRNYSVYRRGAELFSYFEVDDLQAAYGYLAQHPVAIRWQHEMSHLMDVEDNVMPWQPLDPIFHLR